jgi:hypothetical protein
MPKLDRLKDELNIYKHLLTIVIAVDLAVIGWLVANFTQHWLLSVMGGIVVAAGLVLMWSLKGRLVQLLEDIENA